MAEICPFQAWRYDASRCPLASVVTQPYDKITPEMQERYYRSSPYNLVRIILGKAQPGDDACNNSYSRAAGYFRDWRNTGILVQDREPSIYAYSQQFQLSGEGRQLERRGFIALGRIADYPEKVVFRHEQTHSKPKADRLCLLRATRAHFGQIFMLYDDPGQRLEALLPWESQPIAEIRDDYGVLNRLWKVSDPEIIECVRAGFAEQKLIIADGHHRYETALNYRDERRAENSRKERSPWDYVMMTFINLRSPGLLILPTHRVISRLPGFDADRFVARASEFFQVESVGSEQSEAVLLEKLRSAPRHKNAMIAVAQNATYLLSASPEKLNGVLGSVSERQRRLDVVVLHKLLLERVLGISEEAIRKQNYISYWRDAAEAIAAVQRREADAAFLMNPVDITQMRDLALAGEFMPQKSTDFYPKLLSGLTIYALE